MFDSKDGKKGTTDSSVKAALFGALIGVFGTIFGTIVSGMFMLHKDNIMIAGYEKIAKQKITFSYTQRAYGKFAKYLDARVHNVMDGKENTIEGQDNGEQFKEAFWDLQAFLPSPISDKSELFFNCFKSALDQFPKLTEVERRKAQPLLDQKESALRDYMRLHLFSSSPVKTNASEKLLCKN